MKILNYGKRELILQNMRKPEAPKKLSSSTFTMRQYQILCCLIKRKHISRQSFEIVIDALFDFKDWRKLTYEQMYELIHVLTYWNEQKVRL